MFNKKLAIYHICGWIVYYIYSVLGIYFFPGLESEDTSILYMCMLQLSYTIGLISSFYYVYAFILPGFFKKKHLTLYITGTLLLPFVFVFVRYMFEQVFYPAFWGFRNYGIDTSTRYYILDNIYRGLPAIAISTGVWGMERSYRQEREKKQLLREREHAELAFLRSQVNPHFLYNILNYIYSIVYPLSDKAGNAIIKLSLMMRYMLPEMQEDNVKVIDEVKYLENYISLFRLRFEGRFFLNFNCVIADPAKQIAPLLLVPFVENAIKHGVTDDPSNPIIIELKVHSSELTFTVNNKISKNQKDSSNGIGLKNVRRRLELIYPDSYNLNISEEGDYYSIILTVAFK